MAFHKIDQKHIPQNFIKINQRHIPQIFIKINQKFISQKPKAHTTALY